MFIYCLIILLNFKGFFVFLLSDFKQKSLHNSYTRLCLLLNYIKFKFLLLNAFHLFLKNSYLKFNLVIFLLTDFKQKILYNSFVFFYNFIKIKVLLRFLPPHLKRRTLYNSFLGFIL